MLHQSKRIEMKNLLPITSALLTAAVTLLLWNIIRDLQPELQEISTTETEKPTITPADPTVQCKIEDHRYFVSIQRFSKDLYDHFCGGTLLSKNYILTSARCCDIDDLQTYRVVAGLQTVWGAKKLRNGTKILVANAGRQKSYFKDFWQHFDYDDETFNHNICILETEEEFTENEYIGYLPVPSKNENVTCKVGTVMGFGIEKFLTEDNELFGELGYSNSLKCVSLKVQDVDKCKSFGLTHMFPDSMFCAKSDKRRRDTCVGNEGSPFVCDGKLFGLVSYSSGCTMGNPAKAFTKVMPYYDWIDEHTHPAKNT